MNDTDWQAPKQWRRITCIDAHTAGEPLRVITSDLGEIQGDSMLAKRDYAATHLDELRRTLMWEPRGHGDMYGCILTDPVTPDGDIGVLFLHNEGFSTMCGHGIIGLVKVAVDCGLITADPDRELLIDTPAGRVIARMSMSAGAVDEVRFINVPSFLLAGDLEIEVPELGIVCYDLAFGGAFYAYVDASALGLQLSPAHAAQLISAGKTIKQHITRDQAIIHPIGDPELGFLYGVIFVGESSAAAHSRHVCIFADGELDRSPTGTGVSGRVAILHARGQLGLGERIEIDSILGTSFLVSVTETCCVGELAAVIPEVTGKAYITGRQELLIDPKDPLGEGFFLGR